MTLSWQLKSFTIEESEWQIHLIYDIGNDYPNVLESFVIFRHVCKTAVVPTCSSERGVRRQNLSYM